MSALREGLTRLWATLGRRRADPGWEDEQLSALGART